jgi:hypothetical protein
MGSSSVIASGTEVSQSYCYNKHMHRQQPYSERRQAFAASTDAPAIPCEKTAISKARVRSLLYGQTYFSVSTILNISASADFISAISLSHLHSDRNQQSIHPRTPVLCKEKSHFGNCRLSVTPHGPILALILKVSPPHNPEGTNSHDLCRWKAWYSPPRQQNHTQRLVQSYEQSVDNHMVNLSTGGTNCDVTSCGNHILHIRQSFLFASQSEKVLLWY